MKKNLANGFALLAAMSAIVAAAPRSLAQELAPGEYIVGPEQVLSDTVVGSYDVAPDSHYDGTSSISSSSENFAGDMSCGEAGCSSDATGGGLKAHLASSRLGGLIGNRTTYDVGNIERGYGRPDLFYNYYTNGQANRANAQMYLSPVPVPPNVGHTFFTYQPFYPEEMLYWHKNKFHNYYDNGRGMNRTRATYFAPPIRQAASNLYWNKLRLPR